MNAVEQRTSALARANEVQRERAEIKRRIRAGDLTVSEVLLDPSENCHGMAVGQLMKSRRRWGPARTRYLLAGAQISETKRIGTLTPRQVALLVRAVDEC